MKEYYKIKGFTPHFKTLNDAIRWVKKEIPTYPSTHPSLAKLQRCEVEKITIIKCSQEEINKIGGLI